MDLVIEEITDSRTYCQTFSGRDASGFSHHHVNLTQRSVATTAGTGPSSRSAPLVDLGMDLFTLYTFVLFSRTKQSAGWHS